MAPKKIAGTENAPTTPYDGCGMCLVGTRRLSRVTAATNSPAKQMGQVLDAVAAVGGHIIAWADDWEVSGATDPKTRPGLGPWLRGVRGPYDGLAAAAVDRIGRNQVDTLVTAYENKAAGRHLVTADHPGIWDLDDPNQETEFSIKSLGAQMEHRSIKKRVQDENKRAVAAGQVTGKPSYGYRHVRNSAGKITHSEFDPGSQPEIQEVARRILTDTTGSITQYTEAARLTRAGVLSPADRLAVLYGREPEGKPWLGRSLEKILISEAALGYRMYKGRPLLDAEGRPIRIAPPLWDRATHLALKKKLTPTPRAKSESTERAPSGPLSLSGRITCGNCNEKIHRNGCVSRKGGIKLPAFRCDARFLGIPSSQDCKPAPSIAVSELDATVEAWFLTRYGAAQIMVRIYDPGTGYADQIAELGMVKERLLQDRDAGIYDDPDDYAKFQEKFDKVRADIAELKTKPERPAGWHSVPTGETVADKWSAADGAERREMLEEYGVEVVLYPVWGRGKADRVVITAEVDHDPGAEVAGATEGDQDRPEADQDRAEAPKVGRTSVRLAEPVTDAPADAEEVWQSEAVPEPALAA